MRLPRHMASALTGTAIGIFLALLTYRHGRVLTFDGYHYCEFAKRFASEWPDRFGNHWPFGYPLLGGLLGRAGIPGYEALVLCSTFAQFALILGALRVLHAHPRPLLTVAALAAAPALAVQLLGNLTELPLAAALLSLALSLARWPDRRHLWLSAGLAVLAFSLRYAGLIAVAALTVWLLASWSRLRLAGRAVEAALAAGSAWLVSGGLLLWNVLVSGHASGAGRGSPAGLINLPGELAAFGWSVPSALAAGGLRRVVDPESRAGLAVGTLIFVALAGLAAWSWFRPAGRHSRPLALIGLGYAAGMAVLHCVGEFDALHNARTFVPALFPFGLLLAERLRSHPWTLSAGAAVLLAAGLIGAARGLSREVAGDVQPALATLRPLLECGATIGLNDQAFSLAAYIANPTQRVWPGNLQGGPHPDLVVVAAEPIGRDGRSAAFDPAWQAALESPAINGKLRVLFGSPQVMVIARSSPSAGRRP